MARTLEQPRRALGWCQLFVCAAMAWAAYQLTESLPYWPINPSLVTTPWYTLQLDLVRCMWVVLPGAILWGASFPLALASVATTDRDAAALAGGVYAANTVGAIAGSLIVSFILVPWIGSSHSTQVLIIISALSALLMLEPSYSGASAELSRHSAAGATADLSRHSAAGATADLSRQSAVGATADLSRQSAVGATADGKPRFSIAGTAVLAVAMVSAGLLARSVHN